jgi:hypothetical protein
MTHPPFATKKSLLTGALAATPTHETAPRATASSDVGVRKAKRTKLWELAEKHHCPVIGTCLPINELEKIARRYFCLIDPRDEFAMHVEAVNYANSHNSVSEAIQKLLDRKYRAQILRFCQSDNDDEVLATWQEHLAQGEVAGALWAAITHPQSSAQTQQQIFADVHMLSHQLGAGQAANARRQAKLEKDCAEARAALDKQNRHQARKEGSLRLQLLKITAERDRLRRFRDDSERLQARLDAFESGSAITEMGRKLANLQAANDELMIAAQRSWSLEKNFQAARDEARALARERDELAAERDALARLLLAGEADGDGSVSNCDGQCATCDPAMLRQCVLYVGGRSSLLVQYRALAKRLGIELMHHDGGLEESLSRLPDMINGADAVVCPTDCVSHSAYYQLKRQCKRSGKPCLLFKGAGVSSFAVALARLSAEQFDPTATSTNYAARQLAAEE